MLRVLYLFAFVTIFSCQKKNPSSHSRPLETWAFRSVLDQNPRILTVALHEDLYVAYHVKTGALYKVWKGNVMFDGPVYTTAHGPQPISIGDSYFVNQHRNPWFALDKNGDTITTEFKYKGHRFVKGQVELMYALLNTSWPSPILMYEKIECLHSSTNQPQFERIFTTANVPSGVSIGLKTNVSSIVAQQQIKTDGQWSTHSNEEAKKGDISYVNVDGTLILKPNIETFFTIQLMPTPMIPNNNAGASVVEDEEEETNEGLVLIGQSDCKTCHNKTLKTIGPSYTDIAKKYKNTPENVSLLSSKIKTGGSGVWGNQAMTSHPDLSQEVLDKMTTYILGLYQHDAAELTTETGSIDMKPLADIKEDNLIPGSLVKIYDIKPTVQKIDDIKLPSKPKYAGILANFDNISGGDFKDLENLFFLEGKGYLKVDTSGTYIIQIWSDDGSRVTLGDKVILDNDGLHGTEYKEITMTLAKGYYAFQVDYFQGLGGKFLSFNWKRPGKKEYEVISPFNIYHTVAMRGDLQGYSLPMANVSKIPGDQFAIQDVHPSFDLFQARPDDFKPKVAGMDFLSDGRLVISTWEADGAVYIIDHVKDGDPAKMKVKKIAFGLAEPLGLKIVNDTIYVMQKQEMTCLVDVDGDDIIDEYRTLSDVWQVSANFHEFGFGLAFKDGYFYATLATAINPGGASTQPQIQDRGKVVKVNQRTGETTFIASGLRTPNGVGIGYNGELFVSDNEGDWLPSSKILHVKEGAFFGSRSVDFEGSKNKKEQPPVVWLPQDEIGNSPSTPSYINIGPFKGQMIHGEVTNGGVKRVFVEEVNGQLQGCVFRFIQGLEAGINRLCWGPNDDLYVGGIGNPGNWGQTGKLHYGLQRLKYNGKPTFEMLKVEARSNGMEITFTEPLQGTDGWRKEDFNVKQWYYLPNENYGGPKMDNRSLQIVSTTVSEDKKKVFIELKGMKENHVVYIHLLKSFVSANGNQLWSTEAWYTMNSIPKNTPGVSNKPPFVFADNMLTEDEKKDGWKTLFDGKKIEHFRNFKKQSIGKDWVIDQNAIHLNAKQNASGHWQTSDGGDIITKEVYENFELVLDWKIANCGNSGIMFNVAENEKLNYVWESGPEMQILDNTCHPDTKFPTHRAGDLYDMIECKYPSVKPAGQWNTARIVSENGEVSFWLNGHKVVEFTMHNSDWKQKIAKSKFKDMPVFGTFKKGHISLQDHGDKVWFKNIKIKKL
ncbi:MAG: family 16 glycoside hydrolase [Saprospiraceae bacterium]